MLIADYVAVGLILVCAIVGWLLGFGKQLKILTSGVAGVIISCVFCYFLIGIVTALPFVETGMQKFVGFLTAKGNGFCDFLINIRIEVICTAVILFAVVQILRMIIVAIIAKGLESENKVVMVINKSLGILLAVVVCVILCLIAMQISSLAVGVEKNVFYQSLQGTFFRLDYVYLNNPLIKLFDIS
jgi:uncharacterized membrane protein required for colicin V production